MSDPSGSAWISEGFERLVKEVRTAASPPPKPHFDVLIVGSGYGGSIAAATFAGMRHQGTTTPVTVAVLERGREYLPGSFPTGLGELPRHVRRDGNKEGLFDIRIGDEVTTVVANGVGGGSLINAGVMEEAKDYVFTTGWPANSNTYLKWKTHYEDAREMLGAGGKTGPLNTIELDLPVPQKFESIKAVGGSKFRAAAITVAMKDGPTSGNVSLKKCNRCGDCATGCNFSAKISLDTNLLVKAYRNGARIFTGATVLTVRKNPGGPGWIVRCVYTNATLRERDGQPVDIYASRVVLAAGTLGSTEILLRSSAPSTSASSLAVSSKLGSGCSGNGDMLITDYATTSDVNTVADATVQPSVRDIGPTITGIIDLRDEPERVLIEEMSVPAGLRLAFTEIFATVNTLHSLAVKDDDHHVKGFPNDDIYAVSADKIKKSALYAVMGNDGAAGTIDLGTKPLTDANDGIAQMKWVGPPKLPNVPLFDTQVETLETLTDKDHANTGGRVIANPVWKLLPEDLQWLLKGERGPLTTVHPLGGCAMADDGAHGVVNEHGEVFSTSTSAAVHDGLVVLDGSVIPTALGTNPALTISAVALRAAKALAGQWSFEDGTPAALPLEARPKYRDNLDVAAQPPATQIEFIERLVGPVKFKPKNDPKKTYIVELTLRFAPKALAELSRPPSDGGNPVLQVATDQSQLLVRSRIRIFKEDDWKILERSWDPAEVREQQLEELAVFSAPLSGSLKVFERQSSMPFFRMVDAGLAWYKNRGARDIHQAGLVDDGGPSFLDRFRSGKALASRAGEKRALEYDLTIGPKSPSTKPLTLNGNKIFGVKTFTYERQANPWRQLMEVSVEDFPGLGPFTNERVLTLDAPYLARIGVPLMRIVRQQDGVGALAELISFFGYVLRLVLGIHIWSFRQPDTWTETGNDTKILPETNLPGMPGVAVPVTVAPLVPDFAPKGTPAKTATVLLTHYKPTSVTHPRPVVMFHGYSAGGTTFSHHAVNKSFARYLYDMGYDVWVADLRTSSGHPLSAKMGWSFDQVGEHDVPAIIDKILTSTPGSTQVDVVAHCMGAIVFGMAALGGKIDGKVNRAAFTQVAPLVVFSPANKIRAYILRYLVEFLPENYSFNPPPSLAEDLVDRVLATLPYPPEEFDIENPPGFSNRKERTPWTRTRHRMDALYGRDFSLVKMDKNLLRFVDEHFGNVHLRTVTQTLHFVRLSMMTNHEGRNTFISRATLTSANWNFPTFSAHGTENGLSHIATMDRMAKVLKDSGRSYETYDNTGAGHQDALIGNTRLATFDKVEKFLKKTLSASSGPPDTEITAYPPWLGPVVTEERPNTPLLVIRVGSMPSHREVQAALMLRVTVFGDQVLRPDLQPWDAAYISAHAAAYSSAKLRTEGWDAFEVPVPTAFPGYQTGDPIGNGVLVLLTYAEDKSLPAMFTMSYVYAENNSLWGFDVFRARPPVRIGGQAEFDRFQAMTTAAFEAIMLSQAPQRRLRLAQPQLKLISRRSSRTGTVSGGGSSTMTALPLTTASLTFGVNTPTGIAALKELTEADRHLMDGVVPYDAPAAPPTAPSAGGTSFALASCQYPAGLIDERVAYRGYERITARLDAGATASAGTSIVPRFLVFAGDQVYVDPTAGLYDPSSTEDRYRRPYEDWLAHASVRNTLRRIPSFMLLDDHEIEDNWEPPDAPEAEALKAYKKYQRGLHPALDQFKFDGFGFFLLNTRTDRSARKVGGTPGALFQTGQMNALKTFLQSGPSGPKFVVSSSMLLPRHRRAIQNDARLDPANVSALTSDGWDGYPATLREVLGFIAANGISQVVFLSGDEHRGCIASIELRDSGGTTVLARVHSIHTAAMYAPFPFANSLDEDVVAPTETFDVVFGGSTYKCVVNVRRPNPGDGPTFLRVRNAAGSWWLDYEYPDGAVQMLAL